MAKGKLHTPVIKTPPNKASHGTRVYKNVKEAVQARTQMKNPGSKSVLIQQGGKITVTSNNKAMAHVKKGGAIIHHPTDSLKHPGGTIHVHAYDRSAPHR